MTETIPCLDCSAMGAGPVERQLFAMDLCEAFEKHGFVILEGHPIDAALTTPVYEALRGFFALDAETKARYHQPGGGGARGYTGFGVEKARDQEVADLKEFWHVGRDLPAPDPAHPELVPNLWPTEVQGFQSAMLQLYDALEQLGSRVLLAIALHLDLPEDYFARVTNLGNSILRPLHYPPVEGQPAGVRAAAHGDINLITLLVGSNEPGLEVQTRNGDWLPLTSKPGQVICNVGDMLQRLTNHALRSTIHRVVNPPEPWSSQSRYSVPFFLHPNPDFLIKTLPECISDDNPDRYPESITAHDYLQERLREIGLA